VNGRAPNVSAIVKDFPPQKVETEQGQIERALPVRLLLQRELSGIPVQAQLQLDDRARFYPSDAALASWTAQAGGAVVVYGE
jgi:DNA polymerase-3 subunit alpha